VRLCTNKEEKSRRSNRSKKNLKHSCVQSQPHYQHSVQTKEIFFFTSLLPKMSATRMV